MKANFYSLALLIGFSAIGTLNVVAQPDQLLAYNSENAEFTSTVSSSRILQTIFLDAVLTETSIYGAEYYQTVQAAGGNRFILKTYFLDGTLKMIGYSKEASHFSPVGEFVFYYENGEVESIGKYENGVKSGVWQRFAPNGNSKAERVYNGIPVQYYFEILASKVN